MPELIPVSNSEVQTYKRCKRKWWLNYHLKLLLKRPERTGARALGTLLHAALAHYYANGQDPDEALAYARGAVAWASQEWPEDEAEIQKQGEWALTILEGYFEWLEEEGEDADLTVLGTELTMEGHAPHPAFRLIAKLDLLTEQRGFIGPLDHKSTASLDQPIKTAHMQEQGLWYQLLAELAKERGEQSPEVGIGGMLFNYLKKSKRTARAKPPFFKRHQVHHNQSELEMFWQKLFGVLQDMHATMGQLANGVHPAVACYPTPASDCSWSCDYFRVCPMLDDRNSDAEWILQDQYETGDPYARYDEESKDADA